MSKPLRRRRSSVHAGRRLTEVLQRADLSKRVHVEPPAAAQAVQRIPYEHSPPGRRLRCAAVGTKHTHALCF